jgi:5-methylcytosine-specific restriction endonuclease McrA
MPKKLPRDCTRCGKLTTGTCCTPERKNATERGYDRRWRNLRAMILNGEPLCRRCWNLRNDITPATEVHHELPIRTHPEHRLDPAILVPLCRECHRAVEAQPEP